MDFAFGDGIETVKLSESGVWVPILRVDSGHVVLQEDESELKLMLLGPDSQEYIKAVRETRMALLARNKDPSNTDKDFQSEDDARDIETLIRLTVAWTVKVRDGEEIKDAPLTPDNKRAFYVAFPAAKEQANRAVNQRARFTMASPKA